MSRIFASVYIAAAIAALGSCSGSQSPFRGSVCPALVPEPPQLLYPIPGSTGVPDTVGVVIYQPFGVPLPQAKLVLMQAPSGPTVQTSPTVVPSPLPTPIATPRSPLVTASPSAVSFPVLHAAATYNVVYDYGETGQCAPAGATLGSFSTQ